MPKRRYEQREPTQDWQQIRPLLKDTAQITYEVIRPVILWGQTPKERAVETGVSYRTIYYKANLFDQAGMASLFPPEPHRRFPGRINVRFLQIFDKRSWTYIYSIWRFARMSWQRSASSNSIANLPQPPSSSFWLLDPGHQRLSAATNAMEK